MEEEIQKVKKALFINWAWAYNPEILSKEDLDWFYDFILKGYVEEKNKEKENLPPITVTDNGKTKTITTHS